MSIESAKATASTPPAERGLSLPCPKCGEASACISLHLDDLQTFTCRECDAEFSLEDVQTFIQKWTPVCLWLADAPWPQPE